MVKQTRKINQVDPFIKRSEAYAVPILNRLVLRNSIRGVEKQFNKDRYLFSLLPEGSPAREQQRKKLKKLRLIIKDLNRVINIEL